MTVASLDLSLTQALLAALIVAFGTAVQATLGFGVALISAPLLMLIDRALVPGPLLVLCLALGIWMAWHERHAVEPGILGPAFAGRVLGTLPAAALMGSLSAAAFDLIFSVLVLLAVGISLLHPHIRPTRGAVFTASAASGFMSTISSIGGPPMALVYQNARGADLRANLAILFVLGCSVSLLGLAVVGRLGAADLLLALPLLLGMGFGVLLAVPFKRRLGGRSARPWLLAICAGSATLVLLRALFAI